MIIDSTKYNGACECGRSHEMTTRFVYIASGAMARFEEYLTQYGLTGKRVAVYDENTYRAEGLVRPAADAEVMLPPQGLHADEHGTALLMNALPKDAKVLVAVGSGTIHDLTRYCASKMGIPFVSVPTAASVDGFCSNVCALTWGGCKKTVYCGSPDLVIADLDVISKAPLYLALSGMGDVLGKYIALADWRIAHLLTGEFLCERIAKLSADAAQAVLESADGIAAGEVSAYEKLMGGLCLSGLAMQMMGNSRPASGAEHHISHLIEMAPEPLGIRSDALHGEKVGVATLLVSRYYHNLAEMDDLPEQAMPYPAPDAAYLRAAFGEKLIDGILEENADDPATQVEAAVLRAKWEEIRALLRAIPTAESLEALYARVGAKKCLADLGIGEDKLPLIYEYSPLIRGRLTFMRLCRRLTGK